MLRFAQHDRRGAPFSGNRRLMRPDHPALRLAVHLGALAPFANLLWDGYRRQLTVNPIQEITHRTGIAALILLVLTLACTPANRYLGLRQAVPIRRTLGLYAFFYVVLHVLIFGVLDYGLDWELILEAVFEKRYVLAGFGAFLLLIPLAVTSTKGWQRRLGKRWRVLHRAMYLVVPLAVLHFLWFAKGGADRIEPLTYGALTAALLALRLPWLVRAAARWRSRASGARARATIERSADSAGA
jgi:methionine sulfoxide reductase heme-binding subunit